MKVLKSIEQVPFAATDYPITVAEVSGATKVMDVLLSIEQRDELIDCLAFQPNVGECISATSKVRRNVFEFEDKLGETFEITVFFFFFDLNVPLYILAAYQGDHDVEVSEREEIIMNELAAELVDIRRDCAGRAQETRAGKSAR